ncbi:formyl transferase [Vibrio aestuarianus]|uniref:formyl transferase n=2 Tax=Vibrio TaxID=662 RepID=UPI00237D2DAF|nr:formyl transferase [Vibrio aestuarianus]MDE1338771.1 formyl transferase [Vibrio aestuarianus]
MNKVLVLGRNSRPTRLLLSVLFERSFDVFFIEEKRDDKKQLIIKRIKRLGIFKVLSQLTFMVFSRIQAKSKKVESRLSEIEKETVSDLHEIKAVNTVSNINDDKVISSINDISPSVIVLSGTRILSSEFLSKINCPIINIHAGITPSYRGVHGGYWSLINQQPELFGTTIHFVDEGVDTGNVLEHAFLTPSNEDVFSTYPLLQMSAALKVLPTLLERILNKEENCFVPKLSSAIWTHPTIWQYCYYRIKYGIK